MDVVLADYIQNYDEVVLEEASTMSRYPRRQNTYREDPFEWTNKDFTKNFRLTKGLTEQVIEMIEPVIQPTTTFDIKTKVLCALQFFAQGSYQTPVGGLTAINMSQASVSRCISEVVVALNHPNIFNEWVHFPNSFMEMNKNVRDFYSMYGFPGVIGCIDCTHVAIASTNYDERSYVNRKGFHSINTQLICDAHLKIININALFPGSTHDCHIWNNSSVLHLLEQLHQQGHTNYHLIGDSGYPLRPWCLTPLRQPETNSPEFAYSEALKKTRSTVERCNGVLKGRFRCLIKDRVLHYTPNKVSKIINGCAVLHNMCITSNLEDPYYGDLSEEQLGVLPEHDYIENEPSHSGRHNRTNIRLTQGRAKQNRIILNYFSH